MHSKRQSKGSTDFDFWGADKSSCVEHSRDEFRFEEQVGDGYGDFSPPLWKGNDLRISAYESSPLLPYNHRYSNLSPRTRSQAIAEGRKELMDMIHNMPEWSYELSLKDIVDEQQTQQEVRRETLTDAGSCCFKNEGETKKLQKKNKKRSTKSGEILRSESMEKETFLIKMFFPISFGSKKKTNVRNRSKVSPRSSFDISENQPDKEQWIRRSSVAGENKLNIARHFSSSNSSTSSKHSICNSSTNRQAESNFSSGCWPIFHTKRNKNQRLRGCIF
ncbi:uncharacterized protein LOC123205590 [Mangifera indica]|uniref:uncharacterized protein LOC123205590 n=1 Tax=Mangifera indica TaxID=29780 RepID=UPI001CFB5EB0|nr:uncharacterized protein LOC123205590 [Mangifera indica]